MTSDETLKDYEGFQQSDIYIKDYHKDNLADTTVAKAKANWKKYFEDANSEYQDHVIQEKFWRLNKQISREDHYSKTDHTLKWR